MNNLFKDKDLIITNYNYKINILKELNSSSSFIDLKIIDMKELIERFYFSYDENSIYYLMKELSINEDTARIYLNNLYYVDIKDYLDDRLNKLSNIKKLLIDNDLLIFDDKFKDYVKKRRIIFYKYNYFSKLELDMINRLKDITEVIIIDKDYKKNTPKVYEFNTVFEEVEFVAISILKLIEKGVDIKDIKLTNVTDEYTNIINFIFTLYNLKTSINNNYLISNEVVQSFIEKDGTIDEKVNYIKDKYNSDVVDQIINICNKYVMFDDINIIMEMITNDFKKNAIKKDRFSSEIEVIDYRNYPCDNKYIFLVGCNTSSVPITYKDEDYILDNLKEKLLLDTSDEKNRLEKESTIKNILNIKNLVITYSNSSPFTVFYPSNIIEDLSLDVVKNFKYDEIYSKDYSNLIFGEHIDNYVFYNEKSDVLAKYNSTLSTSYNTYDNTFKKVDNDKLLEYLKDGFNASYSSLDNYYKCSFKYYIANLLKLDIFEDSFDTFIGSLFHYVLEKGLLSDIDVNSLTEEYLNQNKRELTKKEKIFVNNLIPDIQFALNTVKDYMNNTDLKDVLFEEKVEVIKNKKVKVTFKGFIDKIMYKKEGNNTIAVIVDYKTGYASGDLEYLNYGLSMQLPIYLYLAKNSKTLENVIFGGFYLQKVLPKKHSIDKKKSEDEKKKEELRLYGYSNSDINILEKVDKNFENSKMIKSLKMTKDGRFYSSAKVLSNEEINKLIDIVDQKIDEAIEGITSGSFNINPKVTDKENLGCKYCEFKDVCFVTKKDEQRITPDKELSFLGGDYNA